MCECTHGRPHPESPCALISPLHLPLQIYRSAASTQAILSDNMRRLGERGEKLSRLEERTAELEVRRCAQNMRVFAPERLIQAGALYLLVEDRHAFAHGHAKDVPTSYPPSPCSSIPSIIPPQEGAMDFASASKQLADSFANRKWWQM